MIAILVGLLFPAGAETRWTDLGAALFARVLAPESRAYPVLLTRIGAPGQRLAPRFSTVSASLDGQVSAMGTGTCLVLA